MKEVGFKPRGKERGMMMTMISRLIVYHKWPSDMLSISRTDGPSDVERTSMGRELQFTGQLVNCWELWMSRVVKQKRKK